MKIAIAQLQPVKGNIEKNIAAHHNLIDQAVTGQADLIVFPELSLTAYEPALAEALAMTPVDQRLDIFQHTSDANEIIIAVGAPIRQDYGICIGMLIFQPQQPRQWYTKTYLHADEEPFFVSGSNASALINEASRIAPAICYELSVPAHAERAAGSGAGIYLVSVAKSAGGIDKSMPVLAEIARTYGMIVVLSNCVGYCDNFESTGNSAVWDRTGTLRDQLGQTEEGILLVDTDTLQTSSRISAPVTG